MWKRYIDDIFVIWTGSNEDLKEFMNKINSIHPTIKFTHKSDNNELTFLDMTIYKGSNFQETGILDIKTHIKKTNKQLYVHKTSYHPDLCKKAIATGEAIRYLKTNSKKVTFQKMTTQPKNKLIERGYKASEIKQQTNSIKFEDKQTILSGKHKSETNPLVIPIKINNNPTIKQTVLGNWHLISSDPILKHTFTTKPMIANKKNQSLANKLVRAKIKNPIQITDPYPQPKPHRLDPTPNIQTNIPSLFPKAYTMIKCKRQRCTVCPKLRLSKTIFNKLYQVNIVIPKHKKTTNLQ